MASLGLTGEETFDIRGLDSFARGRRAQADHRPSRGRSSSTPRVRIDTPMEAEYFRHGGILAYVLRQLAH